MAASQPLSGADVQRIIGRVSQVAVSPRSSIFMTMFVFWMIGSDIGIFQIMFLGQSLYSSVTTLLNCSSVFNSIISPTTLAASPLAPEARTQLQMCLLQGKIWYTFWALLALAIPVYKMSAMGLIPISAWDWVDLSAPPAAVSVLGGSFS
eukprot:TRINITY_DN35792_c0_g1_i1.p1 TRINITY_DN35792_c0_g1~~TRINITY_DN35792_c0_g1_i1.p1  ORF type:complete len:150 (-),score=13.64 TRINITY_DN35792_c0_g1_i1:160-609(-)